MDRITYKCDECGSTNIRHDAWSVWNEAEQQFELDNTFDYTFCVDCDGECKAIEAPID